jgi:hypothetical protein
LTRREGEREERGRREGSRWDLAISAGIGMKAREEGRHAVTAR